MAPVAVDRKGSIRFAVAAAYFVVVQRMRWMGAALAVLKTPSHENIRQQGEAYFSLYQTLQPLLQNF